MRSGRIRDYNKERGKRLGLDEHTVNKLSEDMEQQLVTKMAYDNAAFCRQKLAEHRYRLMRENRLGMDSMPGLRPGLPITLPVRRKGEHPDGCVSFR